MENKKKIILFTFDYELFLKESGDYMHCLIEPTNKLRGLLNKYNIKATFFVDILYYYRLLQKPELEAHSSTVRNQLQELLKEGHRLELHLHPQWLDADYQNNQWVFNNLEKYRLQSLSEQEIEKLFKIGIELLESICKPIVADYKVISFRAGGLCITPFDKIKNSFLKYNIKIDSSVARGLMAKSKNQNYNFTNAPDKEIYRFEDDPLRINNDGQFAEFPISVYNRTLAEKIIEKLFYNRFARTGKLFSEGQGKSTSPANDIKKSKFKKIITALQSYKMPFSLDHTNPAFIISKIKKTHKSTINVLSHIKFLSENSLITIEELAKSNEFEFCNIEQYYNNRIISKSKNLILITSHFPYDVYEGYLEQEILSLSKQFESIIIISQNISSDYIRDIPKNCKAYRINANINRKEIYSNLLPAIFCREFFSELFTIMTIYRKIPKRRIIIDLLTTIIAGRKIYKYISNIINTEKLNKDKLILYSYWYDKSAYAIAKLLQHKKASASISRAHSYDLYFWRNSSYYLPLKNYLFKNLNSVYFISEHGKNYYKSILKIGNKNSEKLKISKLGTINPNPLKAYSKNKNELLILSCSHIIRLKKIEKIIEALHKISDINIKWVHIGHDYEWPISNYENEMKELAKNLLNNKKNIQYFFAGNLEYEELMSYYHNNQIDLFINVSKTEGLPVSIMEAMSFGIPVIATAVGGTPEIVNNTNGILLSSDPSPVEIADAIRKMYNLTEEEIIQIRNNAYKMWKENYNAEQNYEIFAKEISIIY